MQVNSLKLDDTERDVKSLSYFSWIPEKSIARIHILHGMSEHAKRYNDLAISLNNAGYMVTADDHRGHGHTGLAAKSSNHLADHDGWRLLLEDQVTLLNNIYPRNDLPLFILGHSMGAMMSLALCQKHAPEIACPIKGTILSGSWYSSSRSYKIAAAIANFERLRLGSRLPSKLLHYLSFGGFNRSFRPCRTEADWLARDTCMVDRYIQDPFCGQPLSTQSWVDFLLGVSEVFTKDSLNSLDRNLPIYLMSGDKDAVGGSGKKVFELRNRLLESGIHNVETTLYPGARHEIFNETNREEVYKDLITWLDRLMTKCI